MLRKYPIDPKAYLGGCEIFFPLVRAAEEDKSCLNIIYLCTFLTSISCKKTLHSLLPM